MNSPGPKRLDRSTFDEGAIESEREPLRSFVDSGIVAVVLKVFFLVPETSEGQKSAQVMIG
jgi:hypothetical protein